MATGRRVDAPTSPMVELRPAERAWRAPGVPVSVPIDQAELDDPDFAPDRWTIATIGERIASVGDPMAPARKDRRQLPTLS